MGLVIDQLGWLIDGIAIGWLTAGVAVVLFGRDLVIGFHRWHRRRKRRTKGAGTPSDRRR